MLTVDLVRAFRRGTDLKLAVMKSADRQRAHDLAERYLAIIKAHVGQSRGALDEALGAVHVAARDRKVAGGLRKLLLDRCQFEAPGEHDPVAVRTALFERASEHRKSGRVGDDFDRERILTEVAESLGLRDASASSDGDTASSDGATASPRESAARRVEQQMYTDLKNSHQLLALDAISAPALVTLYEEGQAQAVLLRARWVKARVLHANSGEYRLLFRKLKFLRLLHTITPHPDGGYEITIDGPYSLFRSVTKYGLSLALVLPALRACERWSLEAEVEWGRNRQPLRFCLDSSAPGASGQAGDDAPGARLPDDVAELLTRFQTRAKAEKTAWRAEPADELLSLPGVGVCAPDLLFTHEETGECIYLEVMGFWSRDAVWRRVELVEAGLTQRVVFALSSRLRVSEAALADDLPGALYVYKGVMNPRAIEDRLDRLASLRPTTST